MILPDKPTGDRSKLELHVWLDSGLLRQKVFTMIRNLLRPLLLSVSMMLALGFTSATAQNSATEPAPPADSASNPSPTTRTASWGTGFVVAPGYMLTAQHVVRDHTRLLVGPVGFTATGRPKWHVAELVKADAIRDLALLKIPESLALPVLKISPEPTIPIGLEAIVIGFPQPRLQGASRKITQGIVNGYRSNSSTPNERGLLQISAEISQGNSGGPVLAADGTVIGLVQRKIDAARVAERAHDMLVNVNYAMRSSQLIDFLQDTPAQPRVQNVSIQTVLRPHQIYELTHAAVLTVMGTSSSVSAQPTAP